MTPQEKDKFICQKLGVCWHEITTNGYLHCCTCGTLSPDGSIYIDKDSHKNPDFTSEAGRVQLLKLMMERNDFKGFLGHVWLKHAPKSILSSGLVYFGIGWFLDFLVVDDTGKSRDEVFWWLGGENGS